jgi:triacylglycerol lipase
MPPRHHVYLVPGFFGFANLGDLKYFGHATEVLQNQFARLDLDVAIHSVRTSPTASVKKRAIRLLETMIATADGDGPIHLVGHSSGGLDARLLVTAGASLTDELPAHEYASRVRSVVTVATPHHGTPLVNVFLTLLGPRLLQLLSLATMYVLRYGRLPLGVLVRMGGILVRMDNATGTDALDQLYDELLRDFSDERRHAIRDFFAEVGEDQSLLNQLLPAGMDVFNACTRDQAEVRYGCVLARARAPGVGSTLAAGLSGYAQASHALYAAMYNLSARTPHDRAPMPSWEQIQAMRARWGDVPDLRANDGIVPTLSQLHGEVIAAVRADHHDVIGHFDDTEHDPPHYDWLTSGSGFKRREFEALWACIADWIGEGVVRDASSEEPIATSAVPRRRKARS